MIASQTPQSHPLTEVILNRLNILMKEDNNDSVSSLEMDFLFSNEVDIKKQNEVTKNINPPKQKKSEDIFVLLSDSFKCNNTSKETASAKRINSDKVSTLSNSTKNHLVTTSGRRGRRQAISSRDSKPRSNILRTQSSSSARKSTQRGRRDIPERYKSCCHGMPKCGRRHRDCNHAVSFKQACSGDLEQQFHRSLPNISINPQVFGKRRQRTSSRSFKDESSTQLQQQDTSFSGPRRRSRNISTVYQSFGVGNSRRHNDENNQLKEPRQMDKSRHHPRNHLRLERNTSNRIQNREKELYPYYSDKIQTKAKDSRPRRPVRTYSKEKTKSSESLNSNGLTALLQTNETKEVTTRRPFRAFSKNKITSSKSLSGDLARFLQANEKSGGRHAVGRRGITRMQATRS